MLNFRFECRDWYVFYISKPKSCLKKIAKQHLYLTNLFYFTKMFYVSI